MKRLLRRHSPQDWTRNAEVDSVEDEDKALTVLCCYTVKEILLTGWTDSVFFKGGKDAADSKPAVPWRGTQRNRERVEGCRQALDQAGCRARSLADTQSISGEDTTRFGGSWPTTKRAGGMRWHCGTTQTWHTQPMPVYRNNH